MKGDGPTRPPNISERNKFVTIKFDREGRPQATVNPLLREVLSGGQSIIVTFDRAGNSDAFYGSVIVKEKFPVTELSRARTMAAGINKQEQLLKKEEVRERALYEVLSVQKALAPGEKVNPEPTVKEVITDELSRKVNLEFNKAIIKNNVNTDPSSILAKDDLLKMCELSESVLKDKILVSTMMGGRVKVSHKELAFKCDLPYWAFRKLTGSRLEITRLSDLSSILFPKKLQKGIVVRVDELLNFTQEYWFLRSMKLAKTMLSSEKSIRSLGRSFFKDYEKPTESEIGKVLLQNIPVVPPLSMGEQIKKGLTAPPLKISEGIASLRQPFAGMQRALMGLIDRSVSRETFWSFMVGEEKFNTLKFGDGVETRLQAADLKDNLQEILQSETLEGKTRKNFCEFLQWYCKVSLPTSEILLLFSASNEMKLKVSESAVQVPVVEKYNINIFPEEMERTSKVHVFQGDSRTTEIKEFFALAGAEEPKAKEKKSRATVASSLLTDEGKAVLKKMKKHGYEHLVSSYRGILTSFSTSELQIRAAIMLSGTIDQKGDNPFGKPEKEGGDEDSDVSDGDSEDDAE
eukprot:gb/GEZN01004233.1/.p1 GENE.gb/GEZN01004233.1/~~gb/GEZN01004233.1/.p1  ORF type:complete len:614 (-),score=60.07 gb/GEZN01004233.1/:163-1890(-)